MSWRSNLDWENAQLRAKIIQRIRQFFISRQLCEVETPLLSHGTITDQYIDSLTSRYDFLSDSSKGESDKMYWQTSPEFSMKRLLASGYGSIFQICKAFRHEEAGRYHNPEFTLLEWYQLDYDHMTLMDEVDDLLRYILNCNKAERFTYQQVFLEYVDIDPLNTTTEQLIDVIQQSKKLDNWLLSSADNDLLLQYIFSEIIEPNIGKTSPCFIYNFPLSQASLAKISQEDNRVAERFECYYQGVELANGFHELTDVETHLARFKSDNIKRKHLGKVLKPIDQNFIDALAFGLPSCAGVALGVDRLLMLALEAKHIKEVMSFTIEDA